MLANSSVPIQVRSQALILLHAKRSDNCAPLCSACFWHAGNCSDIFAMLGVAECRMQTQNAVAGEEDAEAQETSVHLMNEDW